MFSVRRDNHTPLPHSLSLGQTEAVRSSDTILKIFNSIFISLFLSLLLPLYRPLVVVCPADSLYPGARLQVPSSNGDAAGLAGNGGGGGGGWDCLDGLLPLAGAADFLQEGGEKFCLLTVLGTPGQIIAGRGGRGRRRRSQSLVSSLGYFGPERPWGASGSEGRQENFVW